MKNAINDLTLGEKIALLALRMKISQGELAKLIFIHSGGVLTAYVTHKSAPLEWRRSLIIEKANALCKQHKLDNIVQFKAEDFYKKTN